MKLVSAGKIDDTQPGMGQTCNIVLINAGSIRAPVMHKAHHAAEKPLVRCSRGKVNDAGDATHVFSMHRVFRC